MQPRTTPADLLDELVRRADSADAHQFARDLDAALVRVQELLQPQEAGTGPSHEDSELSRADRVRPGLIRQAAKLRDELAGLLGQASALGDQAHNEADAKRPDAGTLKQMAAELAADLRRHQEAATDLLLESVNTDLGSGD